MAEGCFSKACKHLTSAGILDASDPAVLAQLRNLHPAEPAWQAGTPVDAPKFIFLASPEDTRQRLQLTLQLVRSFGKGSAPGPTGLRRTTSRKLWRRKACQVRVTSWVP